jgi:PIN domain nuclease of toxin-antitoxin system
MRLLLDTVTFIWAVRSPDLISRQALSAISDASAVRELSAVSISEIAIKQATGKIDLDRRELITGIEDLKLQVLPYTDEHAYGLLGLPLHHPDPFDRQLIAQAMIEGISVVTPDAKFSLYKGLRVIW